MDPITINPHVAWALYCIMIALLVTLVLLVDAASGGRHQPQNRHRSKDEPPNRKK